MCKLAIYGRQSWKSQSRSGFTIVYIVRRHRIIPNPGSLVNNQLVNKPKSSIGSKIVVVYIIYANGRP